MIACVCIPHFFATVIQQTIPSLQAHPLVIFDPTTRARQIVATCHKAACAGVTFNIPLRQAQAFCPELQAYPANPTLFRQRADKLIEALGMLTDKIELDEGVWGQLRRNSSSAKLKTFSRLRPTNTAVFYLDLGTIQLKERIGLTRSLHEAVSHHTLQAMVGLASGKFPALVSARLARLDETQMIAPGDEAEVLAPQPITWLPLDSDLSRQFYLLGIETLGSFARLPPGAVLARFGFIGRSLHRLASGIDDRLVMPASRQQERVLTFCVDDPIITKTVLIALVQELAARLGLELQENGLTAQHLRLSLALDNGGATENELVLRRRGNDPERFALAAAQLIERERFTCGVVGIELAVSRLAPVTPRQLALFADQPDPMHDDTVLEDVAARFGAECLCRIQGINPTAWITSQRFSLEQVQPA
jgi:nucleotidyltransferase/DNA polymerase involved in DNA repair